MTNAELLAKAATIENAEIWAELTDQYMFAQECLEDCGMTATVYTNPDYVDEMVNRLEDAFMEILSHTA